MSARPRRQVQPEVLVVAPDLDGVTWCQALEGAGDQQVAAPVDA
jgi:hypothetical protein